MLADLDLDTVDWARPQHAYGPAEDVPDLIIAMAGTDRAEQVRSELAQARLTATGHGLILAHHGHQATFRRAPAPAR